MARAVSSVQASDEDAIVDLAQDTIIDSTIVTACHLDGRDQEVSTVTDRMSKSRARHGWN